MTEQIGRTCTRLKSAFERLSFFPQPICDVPEAWGAILADAFQSCLDRLFLGVAKLGNKVSNLLHEADYSLCSSGQHQAPAFSVLIC